MSLPARPLLQPRRVRGGVKASTPAARSLLDPACAPAVRSAGRRRGMVLQSHQGMTKKKDPEHPPGSVRAMTRYPSNSVIRKRTKPVALLVQAQMFNATIRGWINYYGCYYKSALYPTLRHIDRILARWAHRKFKSLRRHRRRTQQWLERIARRQPDLFAHWRLLQGRG